MSDLVVNVVRKDIKNLHLAVYPPNGRVRVSVPLRISDDAVRLAVVSRLGWIRRQQRRLKKQDRQSRREFIARESHYFLGRRYLLNPIVHDGPPKIVVHNKPVIDLYVPEGTTRKKREWIIQEWYRAQLKQLLPPIIAKWEVRTGLTVADWRVRVMKTRWGTCNAQARRLWFNLELIKKPIQCIEYLVVHEMVHLLERRHNENFKAHMDRLLPNWRSLKDELNSFPLKHERWGY